MFVLLLALQCNKGKTSKKQQLLRRGVKKQPNRLLTKLNPSVTHVTPPLYLCRKTQGRRLNKDDLHGSPIELIFFIITKLQFTKQKIKNVTTHIREVTLSINSYNSYQLLSAGFTDTYERFSLHLRNTTVPFTNANNVWSFPIPTFSPG